MALLDTRTVTMSLSLFFLPVLLLSIVLALPLVVFLIFTLYVIAWFIYIIAAQSDRHFHLPYSPARVLKVNYAAAQMIWGTIRDLPLMLSCLYWRFVIVGRRSQEKFEDFARCNIPYTHPATRSQTLDLYLPHPPASSDKTASADPGAPHRLYPIVVFVYGGSWSSGSKYLYFGLANTLREMGYIVVVPDYRKYPEVRAGEMYEDLRSVIEWVAQNVAREEVGGDREQIYLMGHSAGAQLASYVVLQDVMNQARAESNVIANGVAVNGNGNGNGNGTANDEKYVNGSANGMRPLPRIEGLILCAGVYDINEHYRWEANRGVEQISAMGRAMGANPSSFSRNSPYHLVTASPELFASSSVLLVLPRVLFVHGERDTTVPVASTLQMYTALGEVIPVERREEVDIRMRLYKRMDHSECVTALMPNYIFPSRFRRSLMRDLQDFIDVEYDS